MKKVFLSLLQTIALIYLATVALMYLMQRSLLYHPAPSPKQFAEKPVSFDNAGQKLQGWVLNPGQPHAVLYYGGNAEQVEQNTLPFYQQLPQYTIYLVPYRGYGNNDGSPTEQGLFSDALHVYDQIKDQHQSISAIGRSLGSGVAGYVAANRSVERLVLITPYDSIANVAQGHYPFLPAQWLIKDKYETFKRADKISAKTLVFIAGRDVVVPARHAYRLIPYLSNSQVEQLTIDDAGHNDISSFVEYKAALTDFMKRR